MSFTVAIERSAHFVRFRVAGRASPENYFALIESAARETLAKADTEAVVDLRGVTGRLKFTDQYVIGEMVGQKLAHLHKLASLVPGELATYNSATVANRNGAHMRSFACEQQALAWLAVLEPEPYASCGGTLK